MRIQAGSVFFGLFLSISTQAAAPVEEVGVQPSRPVNATPQASVPSALLQTSGVHYQLQLLQDEIRNLRGMIEELNYEVSQLKTRQMDDYIDIDRRFSAISAGGAVSPARSSSASVVGTSSDAGSVPAAVTSDEVEHYTHAYNQLKAGEIKGSIALFKEHNAKYPNGKYVANSYYWLGEIYVLQGKLEPARESFSMVVDNYPAHRKASDSTFKLGQVYYLLGDKAKARALLDKSAEGNDNSARLARSYLKDNF